MGLTARTLALAVAVAACAGPTPSPSGSITPSVAAPTSPAESRPAEPTFGPRPTAPPAAEECRRSALMTTDDYSTRRLTDDDRRALKPALETSIAGASVVLLIGGSHAVTCLVTTQYGFTRVEANIWDDFRARLGPDSPVGGGPSGGTSELDLGYAWGAVDASVARLTITAEGGATAEAVIQNGYFFAGLVGAPCCIFTLTAYDADGTVIWPTP